jgi:hypothetical protein
MSIKLGSRNDTDTCPYPQANESCPDPDTLDWFEDHLILSSIHNYIFQVVFFLQVYSVHAYVFVLLILLPIL